MELTVAQLADLIGARFEGDGRTLLRTIATLADAGPDALAWLGNDKYLSKLATTRAGCVLVPDTCDVPPGCTVIRVPDPDLALVAILNHAAPRPMAPAMGIHPTAVVDPSARISDAAIGAHVFVGAGAEVGPGSVLYPGVFVGEQAFVGRDCVLWANVVVRERVRIGDRVIIHPNATIGADGFGYLPRHGRHLKIPQIGTVVIEDDVEIGANSAIDRARSGETRIGRGTKIDNLVQIGHNCRIGENCIVVAQVGVSGSSSLGNGAVLGGQAGVADHVAIGEGARVAAQTGVKDDLPPGVEVIGTPSQDRSAFARQQVALRRLPEALVQIRELVKRVERLESSPADDRPRG